LSRRPRHELHELPQIKRGLGQPLDQAENVSGINWC
jgi:hypothetical protein